MKTFLFVLISIIILSIVSCKQENPVLLCHTENLRIRQTANTDSEIIGKLSKNEKLRYLSEWGDSLQVTIDDNKLNERWLKIETDSGKIGWVFSGGLTGDTAFIKLEMFNIKSNIKDSLLYVPYGKNISFYSEPYLASSILKKVKEPIALTVEGEAEIDFANVGIKRNWIKTFGEDSTAFYILKSNLIKKSDEPSALNDFQKSLKKYIVNNPEGGYVFKSEKEYENGDDGAEWTEESDLIFNFADKNIVMGYMYTREFYSFSDIKFRGGKYIFESEEGGSYMGNKLIIKLLRGKKLDLINAGDLSGIYVPGKAANF